MRYCILTSLLIIVSALSLNAQRSNNNYDENKALPWVTGRMPYNSDKVRYKIAYGEGATYLQAREDATASLISELGWERGITVTSKTIDEIKQTINNEDSNFSQNRNMTTVIEQDGYNVSITKIDEYSEVYESLSQTTKYKVWQLYAIDCPLATQISLKYSTKYGFSTAGWRSLIIPGWGQFYKKHYTKGTMFLGVELIGIASIIYFQNRYNYNIKQSSETPILDLQIDYTNRAHKQQLYRNISIGACAAVWLLNVLDATLLEGRPRYVESNFDLGFNSTQDNELLWSFTYKF